MKKFYPINTNQQTVKHVNDIKTLRHCELSNKRQRNSVKAKRGLKVQFLINRSLKNFESLVHSRASVLYTL